MKTVFQTAGWFGSFIGVCLILFGFGADNLYGADFYLMGGVVIALLGLMLVASADHSS